MAQCDISASPPGIAKYFLHAGDEPAPSPPPYTPAVGGYNSPLDWALHTSKRYQEGGDWDTMHDEQFELCWFSGLVMMKQVWSDTSHRPVTSPAFTGRPAGRAVCTTGLSWGGPACPAAPLLAGREGGREGGRDDAQ